MYAHVPSVRLNVFGAQSDEFSQSVSDAINSQKILVSPASEEQPSVIFSLIEAMTLFGLIDTKPTGETNTKTQTIMH